MSVNKYQPHILVLPEDDANRQIANGFLLEPNLNGRVIQVLPPSGGWTKVVDSFTNDHVRGIELYPHRNFVLLIDFDNCTEERLSYVRSLIPGAIEGRVFILGVRSNPEELRRDIGDPYESIGEALAKDCSYNTTILWGHILLEVNNPELNRMISSVKPFLFN